MADTATKIRIFSLAKELGMDSKVLIEHCRAAGLTVKGSALASISPEEKELVMRHMEGAKGKEGESTGEVAELPSREDVARKIGSRMRDIRTMVPRDRTGGAVETEETAEPVASEEVEVTSDDVATPVQNDAGTPVVGEGATGTTEDTEASEGTEVTGDTEATGGIAPVDADSSGDEKSDSFHHLGSLNCSV